MFWKVPGQGENLRLGIYVELPAGSTNVTAPRASMANNAFTERWTIRRAGGLTGGTHSYRRSHRDDDGRARAFGTSRWLRASHAADAVLSLLHRWKPRPARWKSPALTRVLGVEHILTGIDHLLFVLALLIITGGGWKLVKTVTAFTISHSLTLTAATLGFVHVPQRAGRGRHRAQHRLCRGGNCSPRSRSRKHHLARALAGGIHLRAHARAWLCRRT